MCPLVGTAPGIMVWTWKRGIKEIFVGSLWARYLNPRGHYNEYPLRLNLSNVTYFEVSICEEIALYWFDHIAKSSLTRPDETHHIVCCNTKQFRKEPILHGRIRLLNVSPLSHSKYVFYGSFLVFFSKSAPLTKDSFRRTQRMLN